ncbi:MAG: tRNA uracil 4-sulfurtransferase ThiI [Bacilli bacterium]|jgi:thiamine biosynthesis protein ThiI|nr:tRNA uracil 4-sulfurtransferase ThiI [Bacilli bacterium]
MYDLILIRYGEMTLKKKNYKIFLDKIIHNIKNKLSHFNNIKFEYTNYRFYIYLNGEDYKQITNILDTISGISSYSLCVKCFPDLCDIAEKGAKLIKNMNYQRKSFKVETKRGDKSFPLTSIEISQQVASLILRDLSNLMVDVHNPDFTLSVDLRTEGTYIFLNHILGMQGYPSGTGGRGLLMISGGIDSPVAGYLALKKGLKLEAIHFYSPPYTSDMSLQKVIELTELLAKYTEKGNIKLLIVPFTKIQLRIQERADEKYLITLMRRAMYKIASTVCKNEHYKAIINGESIGQVASQTVESMAVINEVTNIPIIRPLVTSEKNDIISISKKIKAYDISIRPYEDCCTVFVPIHPIIKPRLKDVIKEEKILQIDDLIEEAIENIERINLSCFEKFNIMFEKSDKYNI